MPKSCGECLAIKSPAGFTGNTYYDGCYLDESLEVMAEERHENCPLVELPDSSWQTGTPTEEGWYLTKVTDVDKPYEVLKFENGKWSDYLDYDDVPEVVNDSFVLAYQKIEPFKEATE